MEPTKREKQIAQVNRLAQDVRKILDAIAYLPTDRNKGILEEKIREIWNFVAKREVEG